MYACNAQNSYGSDLREITLIEDMSQEDDSECIYLLIIHLFIIMHMKNYSIMINWEQCSLSVTLLQKV